ncbi:hypothetical protein UFOVP45_16 [uncultured Caudovirales phage]|uniref:Uncharacterized protein n=1 Tax=uncultured Caudovirales phage TaxID=2100421 RepID=A0A6J5KMY5_9CAUD|nr:hypothetical protein UFOVP45_16 [uncultured Caudovirales phage]
MIIMQAKARFATYPSPGASHWVHSQYVKHGGQFVESSQDTKKKKEIIRHYQEAKLKKRAHDKSGGDNEKGEKK